MRIKPPSFNRWYKPFGDADNAPPRFTPRLRARPEGYTLREVTEYIASARRARQGDETTRRDLLAAGVRGESIGEAFATLDGEREVDEAFYPCED